MNQLILELKSILEKENKKLISLLEKPENKAYLDEQMIVSSYREAEEILDQDNVSESVLRNAIENVKNKYASAVHEIKLRTQNTTSLEKLQARLKREIESLEKTKARVENQSEFQYLLVEYEVDKLITEGLSLATTTDYEATNTEELVNLFKEVNLANNKINTTVKYHSKEQAIKAKKEKFLRKLQADNLEDDKVLEVRNLHVSFPVGRNKTIHIVRGVDLDVKKGEIIGLVGESGSGKSVTSKTLINVNHNGIVTADKIQIGNYELTKIKKEKYWHLIRGQKIGYIPQDPLTSLNPTRTIGLQLLDALNNNDEWKFKSYTEKKEYLIGLLKTFGLRRAESIWKQYPHTLSGGMKQRIVITMVVALKPQLIIADEPTTALDPTVQASVLALFEDIRQKMGISIILISHNISVIAKFCDYIYVMYAGRIVERGTRKELFTDPRHPYTWALISAIPEAKDEKLYNIQGTPPDMANLPIGDPFAPRNEYALEIDFIKEPPLIPVTKTHSAATWLLGPDAPHVELSTDLKKRLQLFKEAFKDE